MTRGTEIIRKAIRRLLISGAFSAAALAAAPALADTLGYYYDGPPVVVQGPTTTTTTYTYSEPAPTYVAPTQQTYVYEREREREHGAGIHLDTPIFNFGIGFH